MTKTLAQIRDTLELTLSLETGDSYIDSQTELDDLQQAYQATADLYDFPHLMRRYGIVLVANLDRYALPATLRKIRYAKLQGIKIFETELEFLNYSHNRYAIDQQQGDIILKPIPTTASTAYTLSNAEAAGNAQTIELSSVSGLTQYEEIFVKAASLVDEFTIVSSIDSTNTTITARLDSAKSASDIIYRASEILDILGYRTVPVLANASDTLLLPDAFDFVIPHYAAMLAYQRLEIFDRADKQKEIWTERARQAFLAYDKNSTGEVTQFSIA